MSGPPGLPAPAWEQIRGGHRPERRTLATVAEVDIATDGRGGAAALRGSLEAQLLGAGPLEPLLDLPGVSDVAVNGDGSVWVDVGAGLVRSDVHVGDAEAVRRLAVRLAGLPAGGWTRRLRSWTACSRPVSGSTRSSRRS